MRRLASAVLIVLLGFVSLRAQAPPPPPTEALETLALKRQLTQTLKQVADLQAALGACQGQLGGYHLQQNTQALEADEKAIVEKFDKANPGFTLDLKTGAVTKKPAPDPVKK
jgi:hypothetical protein